MTDLRRERVEVAGDFGRLRRLARALLLCGGRRNRKENGQKDEAHAPFDRQNPAASRQVRITHADGS